MSSTLVVLRALGSPQIPLDLEVQQQILLGSISKAWETVCMHEEAHPLVPWLLECMPVVCN